MWRLWAKALGEKAVGDNKEADKVALIRSGIVMVYVLTNILIVASIIHHW
ncbi:hypothetical protein FERRO_08540 [Ferrovum sp. JA12]|nr:hypothetical protein [Ferrovum sp. JA12]KRH79778.1 hypothetical protein FERRO_08540 [Ferrovum sp. JA12]HQT80686.1 hypothetical protein [Ferrovaceae bacterium]HQU05896.1 hypothetical protein [Ferrovaceae bacterium]